MLESSAGNTGTSNSIVTSDSNNHNKNSNKENQTISDQMASVPLSAAQMVSQQVNSVIQTTHHQPSVIQSPGTAQNIQATKNTLLGKLGHSSVIQSTDTSAATSQSQLINQRPSESDGSPLVCSSVEEESKKRREVLARRPSYRKILNELSSAETGSICTLDSVKSEPSDSPLSQPSPSLSHLPQHHLHQQQLSPGPPPPPPPVSSVNQSALAAAAAIAAHQHQQHSSGSISGGSNTTDQNNNDTSSVDSPLSGHHLISVNPYLKVLPTAGMQLPTSGPDLLQHGLGLSAANSATGVSTGSSAVVSAPNALSSLHTQPQGAGIVQYAQSQDAQFFVPEMTWPYRDLQAYQLRGAQMSPSVVISPNNSGNPQHQIAEEAAKKRELRLLKNREAAKECRRKKKEYIKCLENRVAVLETQNKALIDELKSLKELYCQKNE